MKSGAETGGSLSEEQLEEYRQLRTELLYHKAARDRSLLYGALVVFISLPFLNNNSEMGRFLASSLHGYTFPMLLAALNFVIFVHVNSAFTICRVSVYIEKRIEADSSLDWCSAHKLPLRGHPLLFSLNASFFRAAVGFYFLLLVVLICVFYIRSLSTNVVASLLMIALGLLAVMWLSTLWNYKRIRHCFEEAWDRSA